MHQKKAHRTQIRRNDPCCAADSGSLKLAFGTAGPRHPNSSVSTGHYHAILTALPWAMINGMKFSKSKCWILLLGQSNARHKHKLGEEGLESSPAQRGLGMLVGSSSMWVRNKPWQPRGQTLSWGASPARQKRGLSRSIQCWCGATSSTVCSSGPCCWNWLGGMPCDFELV